MPRDFRSFSKENRSNSQNPLNKDQEQLNEYENIINKYKNMNQDDLMTSLFSEASKLKSEGKLNSETLNNLKSTLSPFLNSEQQKMLNDLVSAINDHK